MEEHDEVRRWCLQNQLSEDTFQVLHKEGFTTVELLRLLTPEEVDKWLKQPRVLPLAQSLALQRAVAQLKSCGDYAEDAMESPSFSVTDALTDPHHRHQHRVPTEMSAAEQLQHHRYFLPRQQQQPLKDQFNSVGVLQGAAAAATVVDGSPSSLDEFGEILPEEHYRFLLVGKTGSGKSTTGNSILGAELFDEDVAFDSLTNRNQLKRGIVDGKVIEIMDCPGLFDTRKSHEEVSIDLVKAVACMHPGPHAILYVIRLGRYTKEELEVYNRLKTLFDADVTRYVIVVFTGGDMLEREGKSIEEVLQKATGSLNKVLEECQHRVAVFNNVAADRGRYTSDLMRVFRQLLEANGGGFYTCPRYADVGHGMEEEVERRLQEMERKQLAHSPYIQELKKKVFSVEEELQEGRRVFEQREQERQLRAQQADEQAEAEMKTMVEEMETKNLTLEQQRAEREKLLEKYEQEKEERKKEAEKQREQDRKKLEEKTKEFSVAARKAEEEQRRFLEAKKRQYERKVAQMKDRLVQDKEPNFVHKLLDKVKAALGMISGVLPAVSSFLPFVGVEVSTPLFKGGKK